MSVVIPAPVLSDGVVTLRAHVPFDTDEMVAMGSDHETARWTTVPVPYEPRHAEQWRTETVPRAWSEGTAFSWAIAEAASDWFMGNLDIRRAVPPDIGYALAPWARGRGLMARAVRLATRWAFDVGGLPIVHWSTHAGNLDSWRVAHACGFTFDAERPLSIPQRDELRDGWFASLRPGDEQCPRTTWWPTPVVEGATIWLRPLTDADAPRIVEACTDPESRRWLRSLPDPYTLDTAQRFVRDTGLDASRGRRVTWAVADRADDRLLGTVAVFRLDDRFNPTGGEIGYWTHPDARGAGVMTEAVELLVAHAFTPTDRGGLGRHRLQIGVAWPNAASRRVAEKAGFTLVGRHRLDNRDGAGELSDGAWYDRLA